MTKTRRGLDRGSREGTMDRKRVVIDLEQIELLEQRVVKATELIRSLRRDRDDAQTTLRETQQALEQLQRETQHVDQDRRDAHGLSEQLDILKEERQAIRGKVTRMLEMMAGLEDTAAQVHGDH